VATLKEFLNNLNRREKLLVTVAVVITVCLLTYALLLEPWYRTLARLQTEVPQKQADLEWMTKQLPVVASLRAKQARKPADGNASLLSLVESTAEKSGVPIRQINPGNNGEVKIWFRETEFDPWLRWLESVKQQGVSVTEAAVDRAADNKVTIRLTVRKSAA